jgi:hypothetical protein
MRWTGHVAFRTQTRNAYEILTGKQRKEIVGRPKCGWEGNIKWVVKKPDLEWG